MTKVGPITIISQSTPPVHQDLQDITYEDENPKVSKREQKRTKAYRNVLLNEDGVKHPWYVGFYGVTGLFISVLINSFLALIPRNDVITDPEYFYEDFIVQTIFAPFFGISYYLDATYIMNLDALRTFKKCASASVGYTVYRLGIEGLVFYLWSHELNKPYPIPFVGLLVLIACYPARFLITWIQFPKEWRHNKRYQKQFYYYMLTQIFGFLMTIEYSIYRKKFDEYEPKSTMDSSSNIAFAERI